MQEKSLIEKMDVRWICANTRRFGSEIQNLNFSLQSVQISTADMQQTQNINYAVKECNF